MIGCDWLTPTVTLITIGSDAGQQCCDWLTPAVTVKTIGVHMLVSSAVSG